MGFFALYRYYRFIGLPRLTAVRQAIKLRMY
ncbi:hypothetical protein SAMN05216204_14041 [Massilia yuzhufengensis]|uniref:Uncharacterized protein n=1 Tax=Massilia yuzhufengensis TaxID=1164594 RepID=A0A1I1VLR0_9BURK|nr:hypothetical protein SAMN05216204_14041 [Massilia yuzhufengensis]